MNDQIKEELKGMLEEVKTAVTDQVKEAVTPAVTKEVMDKLQAELAVRKDIFGGQPDEKKTQLEGMEKAAEYVKAAFNHNSSELKGLSEGVAADGGYVVPQAFASEIIRLAPIYGVVRRNARAYPVSQTGTTTHIPGVSGISVSRVGEGTKIPAVKPVFSQSDISIKKVAAIIPMSNELLKDANVDVVSVIATLAAEGFAKYEDEWGFLGKASGEGIFQNASVPVTTLATTNTTYAKFNADNAATLLGTLDESALGTAKWYMSFSVFNSLRQQKDTTGRYLIQEPTGGQPATLWNLPIEFVRAMPHTSDGSQTGTKFLAVGDLNYMLFADKKQYSFEVSQEATITDTDGSTLINLFEQDMSAVRVIERVDIQLVEAAKAFAVAKTAAS